MLKVRITFVNDQPQEVDQFIADVEKAGYRILNQSDPYRGRGKSQYSNVYIDLEKRTK